MPDRDRKAAASEIFSAVRDALFECWDPIGMGREYLPDDEYDSYIGAICSMLVKPTTTASDLAAFLAKSEKGMNLTPDMHRVQLAVDRLLSMRRKGLIDG